MLEVADHLQALVALPTHQRGPDGTIGNERLMCEHLAPLLAARGADEVIVADAARSDGTAGAYVFARWGTPRRVINAHIDTVPPNRGWTRDPWTPAIIDGELYGLGSADTKGAIAATLVALDTARPRDVGVLFSGDEEAGSAVMHAFLASPHAAAIREVVVCEPTARRAGIAHRGVVAQRTKVRGEGGHSSMADHMPRPIAMLARLAVALDDLARAHLDVGPPGMTGLCFNLAALHGGVAFNVIPASAELEWSLRPYPGFDRAWWDREVAACVSGVSGVSGAGAAEIVTTIDHAAFATQPDSRLAEVVRPFARELGAVDFWTEAALLGRRGIDAIVIGPGDIAVAHAADEHVSLADLDWAVELIAAVLRSAH
jgi:acetylornithine deacetylase